MEPNVMKDCPYCAEPIKADAVKCRYCGSVLEDKKADPGVSLSGNFWRRVNEGKRVAGVCTGIAREFNAPRLILPLRIFFILTAFFYGFGFIAYIVLWLLMPAPVDRPIYTDAGIPASHPDMRQREMYYSKETSVFSMVFGLIIVVAGLIFLAAPILHGGYRFLPFEVQLNAPRLMDFNRHFFDIGWISSMFPLMIIMGIMLVFFGMMKALRISIGCGLMAIGSLLMLMFPALLPRILFMPGLPLIGLIFIIIGATKLLFGSTRTVEKSQQPEAPPAPEAPSTGETGWKEFEGE